MSGVREWQLLLAGVCGLLLLAGCSQQSSGPKLYPLTGVVLKGDKPLVSGRIMFTPDAQRGNNGPGAMAPITNGNYATLSGKGVVGGAYLVDIQGYDTAVDVSGDDAPPPNVSQVLKVDLPEGRSYDFILDKP